MKIKNQINSLIFNPCEREILIKENDGKDER